MVCREAGVVGVMEGGWSEAVVESDVGGGGGCCEAVVGSDVGGGCRCRCGWSKITIAKEKHYLKDHSPDNTNNSL